MLSAIAARKAASQQQQELELHGDARKEASTTPLSTCELEQSPTHRVTSDSEATIPRKRKPKGQGARRHTRQRMTKRLTNADIGLTRYFEAEQPIEGFDHEGDDILQSEESRSRGYSPSQPVQDSYHDDEVVSSFIREDPGPSRNYSPSRPVLDTSEDDKGGSGQETHPLESLKKHSETTHGVSRRIFVPKTDINCFRLTKDDLKKLDITKTTGNVSGTLMLLPPGHSLTFVGASCLSLLQGTITVLGTTLRPSLRAHRVFSPRSSPLASIEALETSGIEEEVDYTVGLRRKNLPHRVLGAIDASHSVVIICPLLSGVEGLGKICRTFRGVFDVADVGETEAEGTIGVEGFHPVDLDSRPHPQLQPFLMPESWKKSLDLVVPSLSSSDDLLSTPEKQSLVALVKGPKKCGKSTFARTLLNRLTTRYRHVAFLDCDLGQSEFTPGGMVALHVISKPVFGPPFTHPTIPHHAHYIGHSTPRSTPSHYIACIQALIHTYRMDVQYAYQETSGNEDISDEEDAGGSLHKEANYLLDTFVPLVVNTQGWVKGLGGDLLRKIEEIVEATDIFDLDSQGASFPPQRNQHIYSANTRLHTIRPISSSPLTTFYTPADHRSLSMLSYFHSIFPPQGMEVSGWSTELPLCARGPWEVDCKEVIKRVALVGAGFEDVAPHELEYALNCGIVGLVCDEDLAMETPLSDSNDPSWPYTQGAPAPSPSTSHCVGLALIRGVNAAARMLHILTPVSPTLLYKCQVLVKGELELPVWGMLDYREGYSDGVAGVKWGKVPYLQMNRGKSGAIGGARRRVRKNLMRRGQIS